ncbi:hypothetical protein [Haliscomenobacter sp.]|uniref:hypothetical protein n=1 Tax=Haliscomenobacter sp. TaxID=2717303 RepID=UPI003BA8BEAC
MTALTPVRFDQNLITIKALVKRKNWKISFDFAAFASCKTALIKTAKFFVWLLFYQYCIIAARADSELCRTDPGKIQTKQQQHPGAGRCGKKWPVLLELDHMLV